MNLLHGFLVSRLLIAAIRSPVMWQSPGIRVSGPVRNLTTSHLDPMVRPPTEAIDLSGRG
jgi:hypothetical protein